MRYREKQGLTLPVLNRPARCWEVKVSVLAPVRLVDGSGLSRYNFISAATLVDILMLGWKQWGEDSPWLNQRKRKGQWFKTGYMSGVRSMAGYVFPDDGRPLVFAVILNGLMPPLPATDKEMRAFRQDIRAFHRSFLKVLEDSGKTLDISAK